LVGFRPEAEWDDDERDKMLALMRSEKLICAGCGGWLPETMGHEAEDYDVDPPTRCGRCTAIAVHSAKHAEDHKHLHALRWMAKLKQGQQP
jgi:hypothetical protein